MLIESVVDILGAAAKPISWDSHVDYYQKILLKIGVLAHEAGLRVAKSPQSCPWCYD